ncbi:hypothetical protein GEMRC1_010028 [Eukaryota sp. GEM-RC1]
MLKPQVQLAIGLLSLSLVTFFILPSSKIQPQPDTGISSFPVEKSLSHDQTRVIILLSYMLYSIILVSKLCDLYFVPSINVIIERFKLSDDVAGATLVAMGSSAPNLFSAVAALFIGESDMGIGAEVGSCVFNVFIGIGATCLFVSKPTPVSWKYLLRDVIFYLISAKVTATKSIVLLSTYVFYVACIAVSGTLILWIKKKLKKTKPDDDMYQFGTKIEKQAHHHGDAAARDLSYFPPGIGKRFALIMSFPSRLFLKFLIPDCSTPKKERFYILTFVLSIVWLAIIEFVVVRWISELIVLIDVSSQIAGVTMLAPMTSYPEAFASVLLGRQGMGNAVTGNIFGSNIFDILIALGVPFFLQTCVYPRQPVIADEPGIFLHSILTIASGIIGFLGLAVARFKMRRSLGVVFVLIYIVYVCHSVVGTEGLVDLWRQFIDWVSNLF